MPNPKFLRLVEIVLQLFCNSLSHLNDSVNLLEEFTVVPFQILGTGSYMPQTMLNIPHFIKLMLINLVPFLVRNSPFP